MTFEMGDLRLKPEGMVDSPRNSSGKHKMRTALNLPDLDAEQVPRGVVLAEPGSILAGALLRATFTPLAGLTAPKHGTPVLVLAGTAAVAAKLWLPPEGEGQGAAPGERLVDLELEEPMALVPGQRLLLRRPSPAANLGSGRFLASRERSSMGSNRVRCARRRRRSAISIPRSGAKSR